MQDKTPCACTGVVVPVAVQASLRQRYTGCLCLACLQAVAQGAALAPPASEAPATTGGQAASLR
ncbi:MAG: cysteine-rich CWC family protein [Burkholderiaceae bacterium]|nr:cysteine-rich CWC family protein [Rhodoferax sp.]MCP5283575.1 cysteine-rich CWC family protein [Burkholderiaceae bacterium]